MRAFSCEQCGAGLDLDVGTCPGCGLRLGFSRFRRRLLALGPDTPPCANRDRCGCTWVAEAGSVAGLCFACRLTRTRPADHDHRGLAQWAVAEEAKRRAVVGLDELGLPVPVSDGYLGLAFDLLASGAGPVTTGYHNGVITLDLAETDDLHRERVRRDLAEPVRTVLGHVRHELGHYYAEVLGLSTPRRAEVRALFGDETARDYGGALRAHYRRPSPARPPGFVSAYAAAHPLEDLAETFGLFLLLADALQTAYVTGLVAPRPEPGFTGRPRDLTADRLPGVLAQVWSPLEVAAAALDRSRGLRPDPPRTLDERAVAKLVLVADLVAGAVPVWPMTAAPPD
ncbi:MAG: hypothetical protein JWP61_901 [Friedmanniella sp.]|nr:hypothetical protein [Friedmanniella sp.]